MEETNSHNIFFLNKVCALVCKKYSSKVNHTDLLLSQYFTGMIWSHIFKECVYLNILKQLLKKIKNLNCNSIYLWK